MSLHEDLSLNIDTNHVVSLIQKYSIWLNQNKESLVDRIYKIYANHKINNMFNILNKNLLNNIKPFYGKEFLKKLYSNLYIFGSDNGNASDK